MAVSREKTAILVEGYLDLLALAQAGVFHVVATCGTAFTPDQARVIKRGAPRVTLLFDGDKAGLKAAVRSADTALRAGLEPRIVSLTDGKDPADLVMEGGAEAVAAALAGGRGYVPFLKDLADRRSSDREVQERALRQALGTIAGIADPLRQEYVLQEAATVFGVGEELLRGTVAAEAARQKKYERDGGPPDGPTAPPDRAGNELGLEEATAEQQRRTGPRVRRSLAKVNAEPIEADMFSHILMDDSGEAARIFLAERGDLGLRHPAAPELGAELEAWAAEAEPGRSPRDFVLERWNLVGDGAYRSLVSQLINKEDFPDRTDFAKVVRDCLDRLRQGRAAAGT